MVDHTHHRGFTGSSLNTGRGPPGLASRIALKKGLASGSYVTVMLPPFPDGPLEPSCPLEPSRPLCPGGDPEPPEPPLPPRPPFPPDPPEPPLELTVKEPPWVSTRNSFPR